MTDAGSFHQRRLIRQLPTATVRSRLRMGLLLLLEGGLNDYGSGKVQPWVGEAVACLH